MKTTKRPSLYSQKIVGPSENTLGEINFFRAVGEADRQLVNIICCWSGSVIHFAQVRMFRAPS